MDRAKIQTDITALHRSHQRALRDRALAMDALEWSRLGADARAWHLASEVAFPKRLGEALAKL